MNITKLEQMAENTLQTLVEQQTEDKRWEGQLAASALSTATAICAMALTDNNKYSFYIEQGAKWLAQNVNADGGWGDTVKNQSNISTTVLTWAAFKATKQHEKYTELMQNTEKWLVDCAGGTDVKSIVDAIAKKYGKDKTFAIPILTMCTLSGRFGNDKKIWKNVLQLPFELAAFPHQMFSWLNLPVVSYALPALIAIGQVRHNHYASKNPFTYSLRKLVSNRTLKKLKEKQPSTGGYLEAIPLTSFVAMSLASFMDRKHAAFAVVEKAMEFLTNSMRENGSWPIDINLTIWATTLSVNAAAISPKIWQKFPNKINTQNWLYQQQQKSIHPFTHAAPGGWAWIDLPGGVPDADDTPGALIALSHLVESKTPEVVAKAEKGIKWLVDLQNRDGGIPTFCRGWGALPFDRSTPDLTAHTLSAWSNWFSHISTNLQKQVNKATIKSLRYLEKNQRANGSWIPLWFGNENAKNQENPVYGTARVLIALLDTKSDIVCKLIEKGSTYLLDVQGKQGWGGDKNIQPSIEETALAVHALAKLVHKNPERKQELMPAIEKGIDWLHQNTKNGKEFEPTPIGLYYASLWYYEKLYPTVFTLGAINQVMEMMN